MSDLAIIDALEPLLRVRPILDRFCLFGGSWSSVHEATGQDWAQFHLVTRGACILERSGRDDIRLDDGDMLLLPHGDSHTVRSLQPAAPSRIATQYRDGIATSTTLGVEPDTELICGRLLFDAGAENVMVAALPDVLIIRKGQDRLTVKLEKLLVCIRDELDAALPGSNLIASDIASALFAMTIRYHLGQKPGHGSILALLTERVTAKVAVALLREPARGWTLDELAVIGTTTRATLVRVFQQRVGVPPMAFLSKLRLDLARQRLAGTNWSIASIAESVGYQSEGALSKAFTKRFGIRPGALRVQYQARHMEA